MSSVMTPSVTMSSNLLRGTQAWRMSCSSVSRSGGPGVSPVARKRCPAWLLIPWAQCRYPSLIRVLARQPGFLAELQSGQVLRAARLPVREPALREGPGAPADRVPVLLDQVEAVVLGRDDQREVGLLDERVRAARTVAPLDLVPAQAHPAVFVDDPGSERADVRYHCEVAGIG